jgi:uncharacterized protein YndB with AHSA1/START domain
MASAGPAANRPAPTLRPMVASHATAVISKIEILFNRTVDIQKLSVILNHMVEYNAHRGFAGHRLRFLWRFWDGRLDALEQAMNAGMEIDTDERMQNMTDMPLPATRGAFGRLTGARTVVIERLLPGPIERLWAYLTESDKRRKWLAAGEMILEPGAPFEFVWRNDDLSPRKEPKVNDFPDEQRMASRILEVDPPHRLAFTWQGSGDVTMELAPRGDKVLLTIVHADLPDRDTLLMVAAGWHMHLDILVDEASGQEPPPFWSGWRRLRAEYDRLLPA